MRGDWTRARQTKYAAYAGTYIIIFIAVLVIANMLADRYNKSYDATANKRFSLSDQTAKIVKGLNQDAKITFFGEPSSFTGARDLLDRYGNLSPKVHVSYVDIYKQPQLARAAGVKNPGTAMVQVGARQDEAKGLTEEGVTGALIRDLKGGSRAVCFISGSGERQIDDSSRSGASGVKDALTRDNYTSKTISLLEKAQIPSDCTVVVVDGPKSDYLQPEVDALKATIENGGRVLFLLDPPLNVGRSPISENAALGTVLSNWGVTPDKDLILDLNPIGQVLGLGPEVALVRSYESSPIVAEMKGVATGFPLARSLSIKNGDKTTVQKLFSSSDSSVATTNLSSAEVKIDPNKDKKGPLPIAASGTYNTGKPNNQGRFIVVGSSDWTSNSFLAFNGNRDLLLNMMNWLSSDEDLISIRPKEQEDRRINLTRAQMSWIRFVSQFGLPLIVVIAGVFMWWRRR